MMLRVLGIVSLEQIVPVFPTVEEALRSFDDTPSEPREDATTRELRAIPDDAPVDRAWEHIDARPRQRRRTRDGVNRSRHSERR
jgi:hypothetical protein